MNQVEEAAPEAEGLRSFLRIGGKPLSAGELASLRAMAVTAIQASPAQASELLRRQGGLPVCLDVDSGAGDNGTTEGLALAWSLAKRFPQAPLLLTGEQQRLKPEELPPHAHFVPAPVAVPNLVRCLEVLLAHRSAKPRRSAQWEARGPRQARRRRAAAARVD